MQASNTVTPMGNQTITFDPQAGQTYSEGGSFAIDPLAVASSGLDVVYGSATPSVCSAGGGNVSILAAGTCTITADQPGDTAWNPAPLVNATNACLAANRVTSAKAFGQRAVLDFPNHAPAWVAQGDALAADGNPKAARTAYESAKKAKGADPALIDGKLSRLK